MVKSSYRGFTPIVVMTASSPYGSLSPYILKNKNGEILENIWQFSKVYKSVPYSHQTYSKYDSRVIWDHPAYPAHPVEVHFRDGQITESYMKWREKGFANPYPVRYPVGYNHRSQCLFSLATLPLKGDIQEKDKLNYIQARKKIYVKLYNKLVKKQTQFGELKNMLISGENLLIIEVDGPHQESLDYYREKYGVKKDFIENDTILATKKNLHIMLNDEKHPYGHGYCLARALQKSVIKAV